MLDRIGPGRSADELRSELRVETDKLQQLPGRGQARQAGESRSLGASQVACASPRAGGASVSATSLMAVLGPERM